MEIIVGEYSGFCAGVNYTYKKAKEELKKGKIYCLGEIIHNKQVIKELEDMGMITISKINEVPKGSKVIFRAHGEPLISYNYAKENDIEIIDLTCGRVKVIHNKVLKEKDDSFILIIGKKTHPEIIGTSGFCNNYYIIEDFSDIEESFKSFNKSKYNKVYVVSQTTFSSSLFDELVLKIKEKYLNIDLKIDKTICDATEKRQNETHSLSKKCTKLLVIGSKNSSNTKELYNVSKINCDDTYFVEDIEDINLINFKNNDIIGIVAGASAPKYLIDEVVEKIKNIYL